MISPETYTRASIAATSVWSLLDQRRYEEILQHVTPDCAWQRTEGWRQGHDELRAAFAMRPADLLTRHVITNFTAERAADGSLKGRCYLIAYVARTQDHDATQLMDQPYIVGDVDFDFAGSDEQVLISRIGIHQAFAVEALIGK